MKIAINGFGRVGRIFFRQAFGERDIEIVAINDLGDIKNLAYLLQHDSTYRTYTKNVVIHEGHIVVDGVPIRFCSEKSPEHLPWKELEVDVVVESTGFFTTTEKASAHITAGAKHVVISAPAKDTETPTATPNVGMRLLAKANITANGSCTTNATTPVVAVLMHNPGIVHGMLSTIHAYTALQSVVDEVARGSDMLHGRAAAMNIVPFVTGAAESVARAIPEMKGKFDGMAFRVPVVTGSVIDFTFVSERDTSVENINELLRSASSQKEWEGILTVSEVPLVSTDIIGSPYGSIVDLSLTRVVGSRLVKVVAWYDNEWGYCAMMLKHIRALAPALS